MDFFEEYNRRLIIDEVMKDKITIMGLTIWNWAIGQVVFWERNIVELAI